MVIEIVAGVAIVVYVALVWLPDFRADIRHIRMLVRQSESQKHIRHLRTRRARHDVAGVVEGPTPTGPGEVPRREVEVADPEGPR